MNTTGLGLPSQQVQQTYPSIGVKSLAGTQTNYARSTNAYLATGSVPSAANTATRNKSGNYPEKKFRAGGISATVWVNKVQQANGTEGEYKTVSLERSYTDKEGKWQSTQTLRVNDVPKAAAALQKAYEYLVLQEQDLFKGGR